MTSQHWTLLLFGDAFVIGMVLMATVLAAPLPPDPPRYFTSCTWGTYYFIYHWKCQ